MTSFQKRLKAKTVPKLAVQLMKLLRHISDWDAAFDHVDTNRKAINRCLQRHRTRQMRGVSLRRVLTALLTENTTTGNDPAI